MEKFPSGSKTEKIPRLSRLVSVGALVASALLSCAKNEKPEQGVVVTKEVKREGLKEQELELFKARPIKYKLEVDLAAKKAGHPYSHAEAEVAVSRLLELKELAEKKQLNLDTDRMNEEEINDWYQRVLLGVDQSIEARNRLVDLGYCEVNDPRMVAILEEAMEVMSIDNKDKSAIRERAVEVMVMPVTSEAWPGQLGFTGNDGVEVSSVQLVKALDTNHPGHHSGLATVANEFCHHVRRSQYGGGDRYYEIYEHAAEKDLLPGGYVPIGSLPLPARQLYEEWMSKNYTRSKESGHYLLEAESFAVAFKTVDEMCRAGEVVVKVNPEDSEIKSIIENSLNK